MPTGSPASTLRATWQQACNPQASASCVFAVKKGSELFGTHTWVVSVPAKTLGTGRVVSGPRLQRARQGAALRAEVRAHASPRV